MLNVLYYTVRCYSVLLYCTVLQCPVLHCNAFCIVQFCIVRTVPCCTLLHCTALYCATFFTPQTRAVPRRPLGPPGDPWSQGSHVFWGPLGCAGVLRESVWAVFEDPWERLGDPFQQEVLNSGGCLLSEREAVNQE